MLFYLNLIYYYKRGDVVVREQNIVHEPQYSYFLDSPKHLFWPVLLLVQKCDTIHVANVSYSEE